MPPLSSTKVKSAVRSILLLGGLSVASGFVLMSTDWDQKQAIPASLPQKEKPIVTQIQADACQRSCDLQFNACKFSDASAKQPQTICERDQTTCLASCPKTTQTEEDVNPVIVEGPSVPALECQPTILQPVRANATYLILTRSLFVDELAPFVAAKRRAGEIVDTVLIENIICSEPGEDIPEQIRNYLRRVSQATVITKRPIYVLLVGAPRRVTDIRNVAQIGSYGKTLKTPWELPIRYLYPLGGEVEAIPTDQYYASVLVDWDTRLAPYYRDAVSPVTGLLEDRGDHWATAFDFNVQFSVGRVPVRTTTDLRNWIQKTLNWRTPRVFIESTFQTSRCRSRQPNEADIWEDSATHQVIPHACQTDAGGDISTYANRELPDMISSYSHGVYDEITRWPLMEGYDFSTSSPGLIKSPILFVHGCEVGGTDFPNLSLAESTIGRRDGAVAFIGSSRSHWDYKFPFPNSIFHRGRLTLGQAFYGAKQDLVSENHLSHRLIDNLFMYTLYGDPALKVVEPSVRMTASPPVAFVSGRSATEVYTQSIRIQSFLTDRTLTGWLMHHNYSGEEVRVPPGSTIRGTLRTPPIQSGYPVTRSVAETLRFFEPRSVLFSSRTASSFPHLDSQACNTRQMTCIAPEARVSAPIQIACGRLRRTFGYVDGIRRQTGKAAEIRIVRQDDAQYIAPVTFVLKMLRGGYFTSYEEYDRQPLIEVARTTATRPTQGEVYSFTSDLSVRGDIDTGTRPERTFFPSRYEVEARDMTDNIIGYCTYLFERDIEPVN